MALLSFSPEFASIVERKESILSEQSLKLRVFMKSIFLVVALVVCAGGFAQETHPGGIVYGPKAAFKIDAPPG